MQLAEEWTAQQCADNWGVKVKTWHGYVARGAAPKPARHVGRTPLWDADTVRGYPRPGRGARTDLTTAEGEPVPDPLASLYGQLIMSGWIGTDPRSGRDIAFVYLGTPGDGTTGATAKKIMPAVAQTLGLNPTAGTMTETPTADTHVSFTPDGWIDLRFPNGEGVQHPGDFEWRQVAQNRGEAVLALTYLPLESAVGVEQHCDRSVDAGAFSLGLIPVR